jgi:hypothetical protein
MSVAVHLSWQVSTIVLLTLFLLLGGSSVTFWLLVRRWTSHRQWVALSEWARETGYRFRKTGNSLPPPFDTLAGERPRATLYLSRGPSSLLQIECAGPAAAVPGQSAPVLRNLLIRQIETSWPPTGLRPSNASSSALDLFSLTSFPLLGATERFIVYGTDSAAARAVSRSSLRPLLPPDLGLLLHGRHLVLDFSERRFDAIEFNRMISVAEQLVKHLPGL